jgi:glycosyltransferase involved in cell wall biosynthesis
MKKVAIIGTNGLPANYGGFETLAENLVKHLNGKYEFIVYCRKTPRKKQIKSFHNARLVYLPFLANGWQSFFFDTISIIHAWFVADTILILGAVAGIVFPINFIAKRNLVVNHGGLNEWEREKFTLIQRKFLWISHKFAAISACTNIADNNILKENIEQTFKCDAIVIRYGGDHASPVKPDKALLSKYPFLEQKYFVSVSRAQVDNNLHLVLETFELLKNETLVLVSNWNVSAYGIELYEKYKNHKNIILLTGIYDLSEINCIRSNAFVYIHSHSRCGTSPSLVEAISLNLPIISYDVLTNRETLKNNSLFFKTVNDLKNIILDLNSEKVQELRSNISALKQDYLWANITQSYAQLFDNVNR